jgi:hypothetical protein
MLFAEIEKQSDTPGQPPLSPSGEERTTQQSTFSIVRVTDIIIRVTTIPLDTLFRLTCLTDKRARNNTRRVVCTLAR